MFDWAGTTVDFGCFAPVQALMETFKDAGAEPTIEETRKPMVMLGIDHIRTMLKMGRIEQEWERAHGAAPTEDDVQKLYVPYEEKLLSTFYRFATPKPYALDAVICNFEELPALMRQIGQGTDQLAGPVRPAAGPSPPSPKASRHCSVFGQTLRQNPSWREASCPETLHSATANP